MPPFSAEPEDITACRTLLCAGSRSFFAAAKLLPARVRDPATALYAFCRVADDAIDLGDDPKTALAGLEARLDAVYAGKPSDDPVDRAFAAVVAAHGIPRALPAALIEGLGWDAAGRRYDTFEALLDYAARVAGTVGVMMALIMGVRDAGGLARAADLGVAMQLTNIARDVGEDARAGRLFLPADWFAEAGLDTGAFLADPVFSEALAGIIEKLLDEANTLYARARGGIAVLPRDCRVGIAAARRIYAAIGHRLAAAGYDAVTMRARVTGKRKLLLAARAAVDAVAPGRPGVAPALPANLFLVNAAASETTVEPGAVVKLLLMFERLERSQREAAARLPA